MRFLKLSLLSLAWGTSSIIIVGYTSDPEDEGKGEGVK